MTDWKERIRKAKEETDQAREEKQARTAAFTKSLREVVEKVVEPTFREVGEFAREQGIDFSLDCRYEAKWSPSGRFHLPDGRELSIELNLDDTAVELSEVFFDNKQRYRTHKASFRTAEELERGVTAERLRTELGQLIEYYLQSQRRS